MYQHHIIRQLAHDRHDALRQAAGASRLHREAHAAVHDHSHGWPPRPRPPRVRQWRRGS